MFTTSLSRKRAARPCGCPWMGSVRDDLQRMASDSCRCIQRHPVAAAGAVALAGLVVGLLLSKK